LGLILASSTVGSLVAFAALRAVRSLEIVSQLRVPRIQEVGVDSVVVAFTLAITAIVGILCTLAPVADVARVEPGQTLRREVGQSAFGTLILKSINVIIVMQVALCVMLLDCSFLMLRDLRRLQDLYLGYDYRNLVTMRVSIPTTFPSSQWDSLYLEILQSVRNLPTVGSVATSYPLPCQEFPPWHFRVVEGSIPLPNVQEYVKVQNVTTNYFAVMRASLLRGRLFSTTNGLYETDVTIINRTMAQRFWGNEDPIGRKLVLESIRNPHTIVGVVEDARESPFQAAPPPVAYISRPMNWAYLVVRTKRVPEVVLSGIVGQVRNRAKEVAIDQIAAMESLVFSAGTQPYVQTILVSVFSGLTLVLALVGLYASVSFSVATRVREIGIRLALGATARDVLLLFVLRSLRLTLVGVALGTAGALALTRVLSSVLYGARRGADALVLAFVSLLVTALCVLCGYISARRATLVEAAPLLRCQ
jgi:putative ABC transport system permease protein